jgi:hypothetical protein
VANPEALAAARHVVPARLDTEGLRHRDPLLSDVR